MKIKSPPAAMKYATNKPLNQGEDNLTMKVLIDKEGDDPSSDSSLLCTSPRSPTLRFSSLSNMDTIVEEDGSLLSERKRSIANKFVRNNLDHSSAVNTVSPRSAHWSETGSNALSVEGVNLENIADGGTNVTTSVHLNLKSCSLVEGDGEVSDHPPPQQRRRRAALVTVDDEEEEDRDKLQKPNDPGLSCELSLSSLNGVAFGKRKEPTNQQLSSRHLISSSLLCARSQSLPDSQSSQEGKEMTKSHHKPLVRRSSESTIETMTDTDNKMKWEVTHVNLQQSSLEGVCLSEERESKAGFVNKRVSSGLPAHVQRAFGDSAQTTSPRRQSPLVLHQLKSPQRSSTHKMALAPTRSLSETTPLEDKCPSFKRSKSEPANTAPLFKRRGGSMTRKLSPLPERDSTSNKLVLLEL